jgi:hypothetical protein
MKDSRGSLANQEDNTEYPCIKVVTTIDAPIDTVCAYLSQESAFPEYNDVVTEYKDIEEITAHSKICWSQSPQILFLKPRDFVTFCHHRWRRDGTQVFVNQATEHPDYPGRKEEGQGKACRAYAIRGANCTYYVDNILVGRSIVSRIPLTIPRDFVLSTIHSHTCSHFKMPR